MKIFSPSQAVFSPRRYFHFTKRRRQEAKTEPLQENIMRRQTANRSQLSIHRAFVVQFRSETDTASGHVAGRIEHVASRETASFRTWKEMQEFMTQALSKVRGHSPETSG